MRAVFVNSSGELIPTPSGGPGSMYPVDAFVGIDGSGLAVLVLRPREMALMEYSYVLASLPADVGL